MTTQTLQARTPRGAANEVARYLYKKAPEHGKPFVRPLENGLDYEVVWEGPFEWTMITAGSGLFCGERGDYSTPGDWPDGIGNKYVYVEPYNHYTLSFYKA